MLLYLSQVGDAERRRLPATGARWLRVPAPVPGRILHFDNPFLALSD